VTGRRESRRWKEPAACRLLTLAAIADIERGVQTLVGDVTGLLSNQITPQTRMMPRWMLVGQLVGRADQSRWTTRLPAQGASDVRRVLRGDVLEALKASAQPGCGGPNGTRANLHNSST
jgi:hypothetical protein